ncbi:MAG: metal ABC transporter permease [Wujia sp.]
MWNTICEYLQYPFVRRILLAGVLVAFCASILGVTLVLKRFSYIGDGLSHVAFAAMAIAMVLRLSNNTLIILPITVASAILMLKTGQNAKINGDAVIAILSVGSLAVGYLIMNISGTSQNVSGDVCSTLFGAASILTLSDMDVWICLIMSLVVLVFYMLYYHKIFSVTFDENFARATGIHTGAYNILMAVVTAVVIVVAMNIVGSLLVSALIIFPALSAMRVFKNYKSVFVCSAIFGVLSAFAGILISIVASTPVSATIVAIDIALFLIFCVIGFALHRE